MSCECYKVGGPFVAEDPDCPLHGREAQQIEAEYQEDRRSLTERIEELEALVESQSLQIYDILKKLDGLTPENVGAYKNRKLF